MYAGCEIRLGVVNINVPPLRERKEDIPLLAKIFVIQCNRKLSRNVKNISKATLERFYSYSWPGNVRELQHAIEHAMNILPDDMSVITPEYIPAHILSENNMVPPVSPIAPVQVLYTEKSLNHTMQGIERQTICRILKETGGNISESARILKISRQNLQYRIKRYEINVAEFK